MVILALILFALHELKTIFAPFLLAILLALLILPVTKKFESFGINRLFSSMISMVISFGIFGLLGIFAWYQLKELASDFSNVRSEVINRLNELIITIPDNLLPIEMKQITDIDSLLPTLFSIEGSSGLFGDALSATTEMATMVFLLPVYIFFILHYRNNFVNLFKELDKHPSNELWSAALEAKDVVQQYMAGLGLVVLVVAILNTVGLLILDIRYALLLGVTSAILTVIPYIGTFIGAFIPVLIAFATKDSLWYTAGVIGLYGFVQFLEGNFITPQIIGRSVNLNPLIAILSLLVAGQFWGIIGMIISVPFVAMLDILLQHTPSFKPITILLRNKSE